MRITRTQLDHLIQEEVNEILGFGKGAPSKEYPASELATLMKGLSDASEMSGAQLTPAQRTAIVGELTGVLKDQGFVVKENERLFTGEEDVVVTHQNAPKLKVFLDTVAQKNPKVFKQLLGLFNRSALDISAVVKDIIPSIKTVADREPDKDLAATRQAIDDASAHLQKAIQTISRKDNTRLKAFLRIAQVSGFSAKALTAMANYFGAKDPALMDNLPRVEDLPADIQKLVSAAGTRPHIAAFINNQVKKLFTTYMENPQLIISKPTPEKAPEAEKDEEDQKATIKTEPVSSAEEQEDKPTTVKKGDIVRVLDDPYLSGDYEVLKLDRQDTVTILKSTERPDQDPQSVATKEIIDDPDFLINPDGDKEDGKWDAALDKVQAGLDIAGAIGLYPPAMIISKPATMASLALNASRGKYGWALFDLISLTPLMGEAMKAGKLGVKGTKAVKAAKIKKFGAMRQLVKAGQAGNARKAAKSVKTARAGLVLEKGAEGIVELIPEELLQKLINEKTDEGEPMVPWMIETLSKAPVIGDVAPKLLAAWNDVVALASKEEKDAPDQIGPLKEHKQFNRMKVLAGIK